MTWIWQWGSLKVQTKYPSVCGHEKVYGIVTLELLCLWDLNPIAYKFSSYGLALFIWGTYSLQICVTWWVILLKSGKWTGYVSHTLLLRYNLADMLWARWLRATLAETAGIDFARCHREIWRHYSGNLDKNMSLTKSFRNRAISAMQCNATGSLHTTLCRTWSWQLESRPVVPDHWWPW